MGRNAVAECIYRRFGDLCMGSGTSDVRGWISVQSCLFDTCSCHGDFLYDTRRANRILRHHRNAVCFGRMSASGSFKKMCGQQKIKQAVRDACRLSREKSSFDLIIRFCLPFGCKHRMVIRCRYSSAQNGNYTHLNGVYRASCITSRSSSSLISTSQSTAYGQGMIISRGLPFT